MGGYIGTMSREEFDRVTSRRARVISGECFDDDHDECSGQFDLGDQVTGPCGCACHRKGLA